VKVFKGDGYERKLIGTAAVEDCHLPTLEVEVLSNGKKIVETFVIGTFSALLGGATDQVSERGVLVSDLQDPAWLPGWQKLES